MIQINSNSELGIFILFFPSADFVILSNFFWAMLFTYLHIYMDKLFIAVHILSLPSFSHLHSQLSHSPLPTSPRIPFSQGQMQSGGTGDCSNQSSCQNTGIAHIPTKDLHLMREHFCWRFCRRDMAVYKNARDYRTCVDRIAKVKCRHPWKIFEHS